MIASLLYAAVTGEQQSNLEDSCKMAIYGRRKGEPSKTPIDDDKVKEMRWARYEERRNAAGIEKCLEKREEDARTSPKITEEQLKELQCLLVKFKNKDRMTKKLCALMKIETLPDLPA
jgi:hypothetical protein